MRKHDWAESPLGRPETWASALRNIVGLMLQSTFPMFVAWGDEHCMLYNDAYGVLMQDRHPWGIGRPFREVWADIWEDCLPLVQRAYVGESTFVENFPLTMLRQGRKDQTYFTFSYSPARDDNQEVAGLFCACTETTSQVLAEERQTQLLLFADRLRDLKVPQDIMATSARFLGEQLDIDRVCYTEVDQVRRVVRERSIWPDSAPDATAYKTWGLDQYLSQESMRALGSGQPLFIGDLAEGAPTPQFLDICGGGEPGSCVIFPLVKAGQLKATLNLGLVERLSLNQGEVAFAADVAERTWAVVDRARAEVALTERVAAEVHRLRDLFEQSPGFMAVLRGPEHIFEITNAAYRQVVGNRTLIGLPVRQALPDLEGQGFFETLDGVFCSGLPYVAHEVPLYLESTKGGDRKPVYLDFVYQPIVEPDGSVSGVFVEGNDVTLRRTALEELKTSEKRLKIALEASGGGAWDWNLGTGELVFSESWKAMTGYPAEALPSSRTSWRDVVHPDDVKQVLDDLHACMEGRTPTANSECRLRCHDGSWKWALNRGAIVDRDSSGLAQRLIGASIDISEKKQSEQQIWKRANFDALTGLPNRSLFRDRLNHEVRQSERYGDSFALMFIDLDNFKEINDLHGHSGGDLFLKEAARRIRNCTRGIDTVARLGGDEFTVLLSGAAVDAHVELVAQKIVEQLALPFQIGEQFAHGSASIGITLYPQDAAEPEELVKNADQSMYIAKRAGRNRFAFFSRSMQRSAAYRLKMITDLREALPGRQFSVYFQPIIELSTGAINKAEALIRWHHPVRGLVSPTEFIPLAEETGMIHEIGNWVFVEAAAWSKRWSRGIGQPLQVSVNKSPLQFMSQPAAMAELNWAQHLGDMDAAWNSISVEITEGVLLNASAAVRQKLNNMQESGIQVAIDDFGTGYSSMSYLKKYNIDYLKIDQSFVRDMPTDNTSQAIAESIIVMAHKLGLKVIAEGVETAEQRDWLVAAGCEYAQGFFFSEPLPSHEFEALLYSSHAGQAN